MPITTSETPDPVVAGSSYEIAASGGTPAYHFHPGKLPPGASLTQTSDSTATVTVPPGTPSGTPLRVPVSDSSVPGQQTVSKNEVA
jgi:hypothetical protein